MKRFLAPLLLLGVAACLVPSYTANSDDNVQGVAGATAGVSEMPGTAGTTMLSGGSSNGTAGSAGSGGSDGGEAGSGGTSPSGCPAQQKDCAGVCVPVDDVQYGCGETTCNQSTCPAGARTWACNGGQCVIDSCVAGQKKCDGKCVSVSDPTYGCTAEGCESECPSPGTGTLVCDGLECVVGNCGTSTKKCGDKCVPLDANNGCAEVGQCDPCNSNELCSGSPSECTCIPDNVEACKGLACGTALNNCGDEVTCMDSCVLPESCGGGTATENQCGCTPNDACLGKACGSVQNICGDTVSCSNNCSAPTAACSNNKCVECAAAADCPAYPCAKAACTNNKCAYGTVAANTNCKGGTCSTTRLGVCNRPQVDLGTFKIDATEVTRGNYLAFVQAKNGNTNGQPAVCSASNTSYVPPTDWPPTIDDMEMPAVHVDWCDALAYCTWAGGRLCGKIGGGTLVGGEPFDDPTQSQWMKACAGPSKTAFPYGPTYIEGRCNGAQPVAVASFPDCVGGYPGLYDMSGNSPEWEDACTNNICRKRGSHYGDSPENNYTLLRCDEDGYQPRETKDANLSFRCCSSP